MTVRRDLHEANRRSWNAATPAHESHRGEQVAFLRRGGSTLFPEELHLLGDLRGRRVLHLQCNCGQDTLSLARSAAHVVGVDIADAAIDAARRLSAGAGIPAEFVRADVYDWLSAAPPGGFDVVFSSYGAIGWLSDLPSWARGIANILAPEGRLVLVDFHPAMAGLDADCRPRADLPPRGEADTSPEGLDDYVADAGDAAVPWGYERGVVGFANPHPCHEFLWSTDDLRTAVTAADLRTDVFEEYAYVNGARLRRRMVRGAHRRWYLPADVAPTPGMFGLRALRMGP